MNELSKQLCSIRSELKFRSALQFFAYLESRDAVSVNYTQYKRIEAGRVVASVEFVRKLAKGLPEYSAEIIRRYCRDLFPGYENLFEVSEVELTKIPEKTPLLIPQDELTPRQVALIAESEVHYFTYLVLTMAKRSLSVEELKNGIKGFSEPVMNDFIKVKLAVRENELLRAISIERKFPKPDSDSLKAAYRRMDTWDLRIAEFFKSEKIVNRSLIRRISPRYVPIVQKFADLFIDQFFASDETDQTKNTEAVSFSLNIQRIRMPG